ncbi:MAG: ATP-binding protein [Bacteroidetes bacterium]|jgi:uncharacterized protein|nr:ATP-binding protein [Bacteroidota bacterium]MBT5531373.1 ATP-binding protein [Cytophagia bacterium]MBT3424065.1 ATP-binding protein [Bacteroidota bacterium]MBT3934472.1 ATP-binding protein [Bacteroidota bacterium]MBT4338806.1 ATP-binding protein [Bacteroidota bacterium]
MNPFILKNYKSPDYFCDREKETNSIIKALTNQQDITLYAYRRLGKTALIYNVFYYLRKDYICIYADLWGTKTVSEFINEIANAIIRSNLFASRKLPQKLTSFIQSLGTSISFGVDGTPSVSLNYSEKKQLFKSLEEIFFFLNDQNKKVILAIDEFQEITKYEKEFALEAKLRKYVQASNNISFVFSGSEYHIINEIFNNPVRPFYVSTRMFSLDIIDEKKYGDFIQKQFKKSKREINDAIIEHVLNITFGHTFYVQSIFNYLYSLDNLPESVNDFEIIYLEYLEEKHVYYSELPDRLTNQQFACLRAFALKNKVVAPTSGDFLKFSGVKNSSSMQRVLKTLLDKRYLIKLDDGYRLYDVFLSHYLKYLN